MYNNIRWVADAPHEHWKGVIAVNILNLYTRAVSLLPSAATALAPMTGDINVMIVVAVILIAAFMIFILLKSRRRGR